MPRWVLEELHPVHHPTSYFSLLPPPASSLTPKTTHRYLQTCMHSPGDGLAVPQAFHRQSLMKLTPPLWEHALCPHLPLLSFSLDSA